MATNIHRFIRSIRLHPLLRRFSDNAEWTDAETDLIAEYFRRGHHMSFWGITAKNDGQKAAMRALMNDKPFLFLTGPAGTGKTLITQAVGLNRVIETRDFRKLVYTRLQTQLGADIGALPGDLSEKTYPFVRPFLDNLDVMGNGAELLAMLAPDDARRKRLFFDPIQTMRGGTFHRAYVLVDEVQNIDIHTMLGVATRLGEGTKMVFCGNFAQIDNAALRRPNSNGLYRLLNGLYEAGPAAAEYFDHVNLTQVERSAAADLVEKILRGNEVAAEFEALESRGNI